MDRINALCAYLRPCKVFADVGCDHGYCTRYMLKNGLCERAIISDVSPKSLKKAETLLGEYIDSGVCSAVCCDGLSEIVGADSVMISGLGGEEIINILKRDYIPQSFLFQPMKNAPKLRRFLLGAGCKIEKDDVFSSGGKYYFVIRGAAEGGSEPYSEAETEFGKDSLKNPAFAGYLKAETDKLRGYLEGNPNDESRNKIIKRLKFLTEIYESGIR